MTVCVWYVILESMEESEFIFLLLRVRKQEETQAFVFLHV